MKYLGITYLIIVAILSVMAFAAFGFDKYRAQAEGRRIPENTLHLLALLGGWPGGLVGQQLFRHKTQKLSFRVVFWLCIAMNVAVVAAVGWWVAGVSG